MVDFTDPYYASATALVVAEGSDIASVDDLSGKIVGTQDGTIQEDYANEQTDASEVRGFPEGTNALSSLLTGAVDAALIDEAVAVDAIEKQGGMEIAESFAAASPDLFGFAVAPDNDALREAMNEAAGDDQGGRHAGRAVRQVLRGSRAARRASSRARTSCSRTTSDERLNQRSEGAPCGAPSRCARTD